MIAAFVGMEFVTVRLLMQFERRGTSAACKGGRQLRMAHALLRIDTVADRRRMPLDTPSMGISRKARQLVRRVNEG